MENNQIELVKTQVSKALATIQALPVTTKTEYEEAVEIGGKLKKVSKMVTERKEEITKPMNEALKSARALFKPMEEDLERAEAELKGKMLAFKEEERKLEREAELKAQKEMEETKAKLEAKEINSVQAQQEMFNSIQDSKIDKTEKTVRSETGAKATEKFVLEYVIIEKEKIPLNFLEPDMVKIKASFKAGLPVAGVEERKKAIISF